MPLSQAMAPCRLPPYPHMDLSPMLSGGDPELATPLLPSAVQIDMASLHPELLKEVQHVVINPNDLLLHVHEVIGRGIALHAHYACMHLYRHCRHNVTYTHTCTHTHMRTPKDTFFFQNDIFGPCV